MDTSSYVKDTITTRSHHEGDSYLVATNPEIDLDIHRYLHVLFAGESQTKPSHKQGPKFYHFYLLHIVISGHGYFQTERGKYNLSTGDAFLIRPHELITYESDASEPWHYVWVAFKGEQVELLINNSEFSHQVDTLFVTQIASAIEQCRAIYYIFKERSNNTTLTSNGHLFFLFSFFNAFNPTHQVVSPMTSHEHPVVKQIIHYLATQYSSPISFKTMADTLGYNRAYLSRLFKLYIGLSPRSYLLYYRLDHAKYLLRTRHDLTIEQISASVGIQDALYFSKQFKRYTKYTPSQYRTGQH